MEVICLFIGFICGVVYWRFITEKEIKYVMTKFTDEVHVQYLDLLKQHGIKLNHNGNKFIIEKTKN